MHQRELGWSVASGLLSRSGGPWADSTYLIAPLADRVQGPLSTKPLN
jgi:hypothetical protein